MITTCFGLIYVLMFATDWISFFWLSVLNDPNFGHTTYFFSWSTFIAVGLALGWVAWFLVRELVRQSQLFREWKIK